MTKQPAISPFVLLAVVACTLAACESTSMVGPAGRRARMVDEQLQPVLERDFPRGMSRAAVHAKAAELGMEPAPGLEDADAGEDEEVYSFSFAPDTGWGVTRRVRVVYGPNNCVKDAMLVGRRERDAGAMPEDETMRGWIHLEGAP